MDYKAIARTITDPENQPHQWNDQELAEFFVSAADEIERLREALKFYANPEHYEYKRGDMNVMSNVKWNEIVLDDGKIARSALQPKDSE